MAETKLATALHKALGPARGETAWRVVQAELPNLLQHVLDADGERAALRQEIERLNAAIASHDERTDQLERELRDTSTDITRRLASDAAVDDLFDEDLGAAVHRIAELLGEPSILARRS